MLSNAAPYIVMAANNLKLFYSNIIHVICAAHRVHRIAEKIMKIFHEINDLINSGTQIKNENSVLIFKKCSEIINKNKGLLIVKDISKKHQYENVDFEFILQKFC